MKLGFLTACMPERSLEDIAAWAARQRLRGARARRVAAARRPAVHGEPRQGGGLRRGRARARPQRARRARARRSPRSRTTTTTSRPDPAEREAVPRAPARVHRRRGGARRRPRRHVHRPRPRTQRGREPARGRAGLPAARRLRGRARRAADDRELRDGGLAPRRVPRQPRVLARALGVDVRARALPELRPVAPALARDRPGRGAAARTSTASRTRTRRTPRRFERERNRYGFFGRLSTREQDPWDMGWWRYRIPGLGQVDFPRYVDALYEGGFDGVLSVEHEDPVWGGTPELVEAGLRIAHNNLRALVVRVTKVLEVRNLVKEFPGVRALQRRRPRRARGRGALPARPERRRQVDADQVRLRRGRADERRDPVPGRAAAAGRSGGVAQARRRDDLPGARPRPGPERRREHLPRARAAARAAARPRRDVPRVGGAARAARARVDPRAREGREAAAGGAADRLDRARAVGQRAAADHGRAVRDPRRGRDRARSSTSSAGSPPRASASSTSPTVSTRSAASATASPSSPTAARPRPACRRRRRPTSSSSSWSAARSSSSTPTAPVGTDRRAARGPRREAAARRARASASRSARARSSASAGSSAPAAPSCSG